MVLSVEDLLKVLPRALPDAFVRLCDIHDLSSRNDSVAVRALIRTYKEDYESFFSDLRKQDLTDLFDGRLGLEDRVLFLSHRHEFSKTELVDLAVAFFRDGRVPHGMISEDDDEDDEDDESSSDDWGDPSVDESDEPQDFRTHGYHQAFWDDLAYSPEDASTPLWPFQKEAIRALLAALNPRTPQILGIATGGGKTRVANTLVQDWLRRSGGPIVWVTKDWRLLHQAATDASRRLRGVELRRLGGNGTALHPLPEGPTRDIVYSTIHTMVRRLSGGVLRKLKPSLLVWDECHWGEHAEAGDILTRCQRSGVPVLGLTATPRRNSRYEVAYSKTFLELVEEGFLARPIVKKPVRTGIDWRPQFRRTEDVTPASLRELAESEKRNHVIVNHYAANVREYGKTIVFACNVDHVNRLVRMFESRGFAVRGMHCYQMDAWNQRALKDFRSGAVQILVNVEMMTHGIDVPDARTVFLCRPTGSDILFSQMVGRGARRDPSSGKTSFYIVEFTDNVREHGELLQSAQRYFEGATSRREERPRADSSMENQATHRRAVHRFDPAGAPTWIPSHNSIPKWAHGLWYRAGQTFGIEFELTPEHGAIPEPDREWAKRARILLRKLSEVLPGKVAEQPCPEKLGSEHRKDNSVWNVVYDGSAGWEITSPVLSELDGFMDVDRACSALASAASELGLCVNHRTGTHVHLGWRGKDVEEVLRVLRLVRVFEPALASIVAPSRIVAFRGGHYDLQQPNDFCRPVATVFSNRVLKGIRTFEDIERVTSKEGARNITFNIKPIRDIDTVEVRMHGGTLEARKILLWVSLWQQILWAASHRTTAPQVPDVTVLQPEGDIVRLAMEWLPDAQQPQQMGFLKKLAARRREIVNESWARIHELQPWMTAATDWQR